MTEFAQPDCLVLKFEERETHSVTNEIDTTIYILYDKKEHNYVIRGRRRWTPKYQSATYSFVSEDVYDLADFLQYIICKSNDVNETLFNYDNLPLDSTDITFEFLQQHDHDDYEISGYNNIKMTKNNLVKKLKMLRNVFNYYK
jgi:hypothetical protein